MAHHCCYTCGIPLSEDNGRFRIDDEEWYCDLHFQVEELRSLKREKLDLIKDLRQSYKLTRLREVIRQIKKLEGGVDKPEKLD